MIGSWDLGSLITKEFLTLNHLHPKVIVKRAITTIIKKEGKEEIKKLFIELGTEIATG